MRSLKRLSIDALLVPAATAGVLFAATPANAFLSVFGAPSAAAALPILATTGVVTGAVVAGEVAVEGSGKFIAAGAIAVLVIDPVFATYYNGSFGIRFAPDMLTPVSSGWLGTWGATPGDPAPPVYPTGTFPVGTAFNIQPPNAGLTASVVNDVVNGLQTVTFDWGPSGHAQTDPGHFNFFASVFQARTDLLLFNLGAAAAPAAGANLFTTTFGISCSAAGSSVLTQCGSDTSNSFRTAVVPLPAGWVTMLIGFGMFGAMARSRRVNGPKSVDAL